MLSGHFRTSSSENGQTVEEAKPHQPIWRRIPVKQAARCQNRNPNAQATSRAMILGATCTHKQFWSTKLGLHNQRHVVAQSAPLIFWLTLAWTSASPPHQASVLWTLTARHRRVVCVFKNRVHCLSRGKSVPPEHAAGDSVA